MKLAVGVDLGGTRLRAALIDCASPSPKPLAERRVDIGEDRTPSRVAELLSSAVDAVSQGAPEKIHGVGIGIAAMLRGETGIVANAPNLGWQEVDFRHLARERLPGPVELYNDLNAIAWGEHCYGAGKGVPNLLCVFVGTGIGGGIVVGSRLYIGAGNLAGEIGHTRVVMGELARLCGCGQRGCLEAYAGGALIQARVRGELAAGKRSQALELAGGNLQNIHAGHIDAAARAGDPYARALWQEIAPLLGLALANAVTLLDPDRLVMGGSVWDGSPELRRMALEAFDRLTNPPARQDVQVVQTMLGDLAGVLGSANLIAQVSA